MSIARQAESNASSVERKRPELLLLGELEKRKRADPGFSMRRCARLVGISSGALSEILAGKRPLTFRTAARFAEGLGLAPAARQALFLSLVSAQGEGAEKSGDTERPGRKLLANDLFRAISEWHYYAILSLSEVEGATADPSWIARRLAISRAEAGSALQRLECLGLIRVEGARYFQTHRGVTTSHELAALALQRFHRQLLRKGGEAQPASPASERHLGALTLATSSARFAEAQKRIAAFQRELAAFLNEGPKERVYSLAVGLFPLDRGEGGASGIADASVAGRKETL